MKNYHLSTDTDMAANLSCVPNFYPITVMELIHFTNYAYIAFLNATDIKPMSVM